MKLYYLVTASVLAFSALATTQAANATESANGFAKKATVSGEFEIESSKLALEKSQNKDVKNFAQEMITDHTKAGDNLKSTLQTAKLELPKDELDAKHQKLMNDLQAASGDDFNRLYVGDQVDGHKEAVALFTDYSQNGDNADLKNFAAQTLPTLQEHQKHIKDLKSKIQ